MKFTVNRRGTRGYVTVHCGSWDHHLGGLVTVTWDVIVTTPSIGWWSGSSTTRIHEAREMRDALNYALRLVEAFPNPKEPPTDEQVEAIFKETL